MTAGCPSAERAAALVAGSATPRDEDTTAVETVITRAGLELVVRPVLPSDELALFAAWAEAVERGEFPRRPPAREEAFRRAWLEDKSCVLVALDGDSLAGSYFIRPAYEERGSDIANAGYLVPGAHRRRGVGRALLEHSLAEARRRGFRAMLFLRVGASNPSGRMYEEAGFERVGRIPGGLGDEDALIFWRAL